MTEYICTHCGYEGGRRVVKNGSRGMELFMWTVLMVPGPFYTAWRIFSKAVYCPHCHALKSMVRARSTEGIVTRYEMDKAIGGEAEEVIRF